MEDSKKDLNLTNLNFNLINYIFEYLNITEIPCINNKKVYKSSLYSIKYSLF